MKLNKNLLEEILKELQSLNIILQKYNLDRLNTNATFKELKSFLKDQYVTSEEILRILQNYQSVVEFQIDNGLAEKALISKVKGEVDRNSNFYDQARADSVKYDEVKVISSDSEPVFTRSKPFLQYVAESTIYGISVNERISQRSGFREDLSVSTFDDVDSFCGQTPVTPGELLQVVSTSQDDNQAGNGAQQVTISGISDLGLRQHEVVTLNGTTPVPTSQTFKYVDIFVVSRNSIYDGSAKGTIKLLNINGTRTIARISPGANMWLCSKFYTGSNQKGYVHQWAIGACNSSIRFQMMLSLKDDINTVIPIIVINTKDSGANFLFPAPIVIPPLGRVKISAKADETLNHASTNFAVHCSNEVVT